MAPKGEEQVSLRELVRQHMNDSNDRTTLILTKLATIETHSSYAKDKMLEHDKSIELLKEDNNKNKGTMKAVGFFSSVIGLVALIKSFFGH